MYLSIYINNYKNYNILEIIIETNRTTSYMLTFVFIYKSKNKIKVSYVNNIHYKNATNILERFSIM